MCKSAITHDYRPISSNVLLGSSLISVNNANFANYVTKKFPQSWPSANKAHNLPDTHVNT